MASIYSPLPYNFFSKKTLEVKFSGLDPGETESNYGGIKQRWLVVKKDRQRIWINSEKINQAIQEKIF